MSDKCLLLGVLNYTDFCGFVTSTTATLFNDACLNAISSAVEEVSMNKVDIPSIIGSLALGYQFNWGLYGLLIVQVYMYTQSTHSDSWGLQALVYFLFLLETTQTILATYDSWFQFARTVLVYDRYHTWLEIPIITGITSTTIQCFYAWRIHLLGGSRYVAGLIIAIALMQGTAAIANGVVVEHNSRHARSLAELFDLDTSVIWLGGTAVCDVIICVCMVWLLSRKESSFRGTNTVIKKLITLVIETGMATAILAIITLVLFWRFKDSLQYIAPAFMISKVYSNSLLVILLNRPSMREGQHELPAESRRIQAPRAPERDKNTSIQVTICRETYDDELAMVTLPTRNDCFGEPFEKGYEIRH